MADTINLELKSERESYMYKTLREAIEQSHGLRLCCEFVFPDYKQAIAISTPNGYQVFWVDEFQVFESDM